LRARLGRSAANLIVSVGDDIKKARALYDDLAKLLDGHSEEPEVREAYARGVHNLIVVYKAQRNDEDLAQARTIYDKLAVLGAKHSSQLSVRLDQARSAYNLLSAYVDARRLGPAIDMYKGLSALAEAQLTEPAFYELSAKGAVNLISACCSSEGTGATVAKSLYNDVAALAQNKPDEPVLREQLDWAGVNLIPCLGVAEATQHYERLVTPWSKHLDSESRRMHARAAANMIVCYGRSEWQRIGDARVLYYDGVIAALANAHPEDDELHGIRVRAMSNLVGYYRRNGNLAAATQLYEELAEFARRQPGDRSLEQWREIAAHNLIVRPDES
jgi:hypothetical protein